MGWQRITHRTASEWTAGNYTLLNNELGVESDTQKQKLGDGTTTWTSLGYNTPNGGARVYRALLTQTGTDAPVATVLENTLGGTVVWARSVAGVYTGAYTGAFPDNKTFVVIGFNNNGGNAGDGNYIQYLFWKSAEQSDTVSLAVNDVDLVAGTYTSKDSALNQTPIEILVYP